jgi:hypothetical protein
MALTELRQVVPTAITTVTQRETPVPATPAATKTPTALNRGDRLEPSAFLARPITSTVAATVSVASLFHRPWAADAPLAGGAGRILTLVMAGAVGGGVAKKLDRGLGWGLAAGAASGATVAVVGGAAGAYIGGMIGARYLRPGYALAGVAIGALGAWEALRQP